MYNEGTLRNWRFFHWAGPKSGLDDVPTVKRPP